MSTSIQHPRETLGARVCAGSGWTEAPQLSPEGYVGPVGRVGRGEAPHSSSIWEHLRGCSACLLLYKEREGGGAREPDPLSVGRGVLCPVGGDLAQKAQVRCSKAPALFSFLVTGRRKPLKVHPSDSEKHLTPSAAQPRTGPLAQAPAGTKDWDQ